MRRIRKTAGFLFAVALVVICSASMAVAGSGNAKYFRPKAPPVAKDSPRLTRDQERQTLKESLLVPGGATRDELDRLEKKVRMRVADGYVRHISAPRPAYFPVDKDAYAPLVFQGPSFVQTAHKFLKTNQELICSRSNRVAFQTNKRRLNEGRGYVRMQQVYDGLPVFGGSVIVQTHGEDGVTALFSDVLRDLTRLDNGLVSTVPTITPEFAQKAAIRKVSGEKFQPGDLVASQPVLTIYEPGVVGLTGELQLVWDTTVTMRDAALNLLQERVLVNAQSGTIALQFNEVRTSLYRSVYDNEDRTWEPPGANHPYHWFNDDNGPAYARGKCRRWEEEMFCLNHQVNNQSHNSWPDQNSYDTTVYQPVPWCNIAYDYLADIYMFYNSQVQRDSYGPAPDPFGEGPGPIQPHGAHQVEHPNFATQKNDVGEGYELMLTTRLNLDNAFFSMYGGEPYLSIGTRYQACDDVIAHEYTHGVTNFEAGFLYLTESGALDESFSDMWGEWIDLTNTPYGTIEDPVYRAVRWVMGEDTDCPYNGAAGDPSGYYRPEAQNVEWEIARSLAIRDMRNPPYYGQPDKMTSPYFWTEMGDNGGVHTNSGVTNKLAYLLSDGDTFNNQVVLPMGITDALTTFTYYTYPKPPTSSRTAPQLIYETQCNLLNPASDFEDFYYALMQACDNLVLSESEKENVDKACIAVEIKPARISEAYNIVYKDKRNPALQPLIDDETNEIIIADPQAYGTLKITKKKGFPKQRLYDTPHGATIRVIRSAGTLLNVYTEADVDDLGVNGELPSVTAKGCYIKQIWAGGEIGTVRETDYARSWSTSADMDMTYPAYPVATFTSGEYYLTSIYSNSNWTPGRLKSGAQPFKLELNGVGFLQVYAPAQSATVSVATKKWKMPLYQRDIDSDQMRVVGYSDDFSYAGTPASFFGTDGQFGVGELKSYRSVGASFLGLELNSLARTSVVTDIKTFSLVSTPAYAGFKYVIYYANVFQPPMLDLGSDKLRVQNEGGLLTPGVTSVAGEISLLRAHARWYTVTNASTTTVYTTGTVLRTYTEQWGGGGLVGAYYSDGSPYDNISVFQSGMDPSSEFQNIVNVQASNYIRGDFQAGVEFDSDGNAVAIRGDIKSLNLIHLPIDDNVTTSTFIMGHGWTIRKPKFKGDHSAFIIHDLPYVPTDPY